MELTIDQALQKAVAAHKAGQVQEADRVYTAILKVQPKHPDANHNLGVLAVGVGKAQEALPFLKTALEAKPSIAQFWLSYIDVLIKLDRMDDAKAVLDQAKSKGAKGDGFDKLETWLSEADESSALDKAFQLRDSGEYNQAIELLKDELKKFPDHVDILALLSHCYLLSDHVGEAKIHLDKATTIAPDNAAVGWNTARLNLKEQKPLEALNVARNTNRRFPGDIEGMGVLGACLRENGEIVESLEILNRAIELSPNYAEALVNRGLIRLRVGNKPQALADLEMAHRLKPHIKQIWNLVIGLKVEAQDHSGAISLLANMIEIDPENVELLATLAICYQHLNKFDSAIEAYRKALAIKPDYVTAQTNLGSALQEQGKLEEAVMAYKKVLAIKPDHIAALTNLGSALQEQGKLEEAMEIYNRALNIKPDSAETYNSMGNALQEQGKLEEAIEIYNKALAIKPDYAEVIENSESLAVQLLPIIVNYGYNFDTSAARAQSEVELRPKYQMQNAIRAYIEADFSKAALHNRNFKNCDQKFLSQLNPKDKVFCNAYSDFIDKLLNASWNEEPVSKNNVYHLGESHCLSYAHRHITVGGSDFRIVPRMTFGAKVFHLSRTKCNKFKAITKAHLASLPKNSKVFLSYGEIDCRPNEGFISAAIKHDKLLEEIIDQTTEACVKWFWDQNADQRHRLYFLNVPAPLYNHKQSTDLNAQVANCVALFNSALKNCALNYGFDIIDVYKFTSGKDGFSNGLFHIDSHHLGANAIPEIERQLL